MGLLSGSDESVLEQDNLMAAQLVNLLLNYILLKKANCMDYELFKNN